MSIDELVKKFYAEAEKQNLHLIVGGGHSIEIARETFGLLNAFGLFKKDIDILDFGCGFGRLAIPILKELNKENRYIGIDIVPKLIAYAKKTIEINFTNAKFFLLADKNKHYEKYFDNVHLDGNTISNMQEICSNIDFIMNFSVFTHLEKKDAKKYLSEFFDILKPGGSLLISTFFINDESIGNIEKGYSQIHFSRDRKDEEGLYISDLKNKLSAVGYSESDLTTMAINLGFSIERIYYGKWCGRFSRLSFQDVIVLRKPENYNLPTGFDPNRYLMKNPDVAKSGMNPIYHYLQYGINENRKY